MKTHFSSVALLCLSALVWAASPRVTFASDPNLPSQLEARNIPPGPPGPLEWETDFKKMETKENQLTADFTFGFTNISDKEVIIQRVQPSCSCTVAKLPEQPWHLAPHTNGQLAISVDLKGKAGEFEKQIRVWWGGKDSKVDPKELRVSVKMPDRNLMRAKNMKIALADRQAVFKGECANCHAAPAKKLSGMALYHEVCGVCHEAHPRNPVVPDLRLLPHPTDLAFWKTNIIYGKAGTMMPAFAQSQGGPLTEAQVDELANAIEAAFPYSRFGGHPPQPQPAPPEVIPAGAPRIGGKPIIKPDGPDNE